MYHVRGVPDAGLELVDEHGPVCPLPDFMAGQYRATVEEIHDELGEDVTIRVRPGFTSRGGEPVLVVWAVDSEGDRLGEYGRDGVHRADFVFRTGPVGGKTPVERLDWHTDTPDWARQVGGVSHLETSYLGRWVAADAGTHRDFRRELEHRCAQGSQAACEALDRAGLAPPIVEAGPEPIARLADELEAVSGKVASRGDSPLAPSPLGPGSLTRIYSAIHAALRDIARDENLYPNDLRLLLAIFEAGEPVFSDVLEEAMHDEGTALRRSSVTLRAAGLVAADAGPGTTETKPGVRARLRTTPRGVRLARRIVTRVAEGC